MNQRQDWNAAPRWRKKLLSFEPVQAAVTWWNRHPKIAEFISYFMVGNIVTIIQFIMLPVLQAVLKNTSLVYTDLHLFGPIGDPTATTTVTVAGVDVTGLNPYYVFNYTGGPVNTLVPKTLNGITGEYLAHGGVAFFLAMFLTLIVAQILTFYMQRNITFKSKGNLAWQIFWFVIATCMITLGANALYGLYQPWLYGVIGEELGGQLASLLQCIISFWVFYPIFKLIFPKKTQKN